ncbi:MAG: VOC family protein [Anaerovoracaceae bacterium]|jgi:lactoylglutathione lyase
MFGHVTIYVRNIEESLRFYQEIVGLEVTRRFPGGPGVEIVFLGDGKGKTEIELIKDDKCENVDLGKDISLGFEVEALEKTFKYVAEKGYDSEGGIIQPTPNVKFFFIRDPNGLKIQFVEYIV